MEKVSFLMTKFNSSFCILDHIPSPLAFARTSLLEIFHLASLHLYHLLDQPHKICPRTSFIRERGLLMTQWNCIFLSSFSSSSQQNFSSTTWSHFFIFLTHSWQAAFLTILTTDLYAGKYNDHFSVFIFLSLSAKADYFHLLETVFLIFQDRTLSLSIFFLYLSVCSKSLLPCL